MPSIMRNNIRYGSSIGGGSSNGEIMELTQAEYDALGDSVLTDNKTYYITDADDQYNASSVIFDNTDTNLNAVDVQSAIVEQNKNLEWKLAGSMLGGGEILLPSDFSELNILHSSSKSNYVIHMCRELVSDVGYNISNGYYVSADNNDVTTINVSLSKVIGMYNVSQIVVYYR